MKMNSATRSSNPYPQFSTFGDARTYLDSLRNTLTYSWSGVEHVIKFLSDSLQEKINHIEALRGDLAACQSSLNAKTYSLQQMEQSISHLSHQLLEKDRVIHQRDAIIQQKNTTVQRCEITLQKVLSDKETLQHHFGAELEEAKVMRAKIPVYEQKVRALSSENEELRLRLNQQVQTEQPGQGVFKEFNLTDAQHKRLLQVIEKELTQRAAVVYAKAKETIAVEQRKSEQRIKGLEEQLIVLRTGTKDVVLINHADPPPPPPLLAEGLSDTTINGPDHNRGYH